MEGGFGRIGIDEQVHLAVRGYPVGSRGQVGLRVELATPLDPGDRVQAQHRVGLEVLTTYERLGAFGRDLTELADGHEKVARIDGERLSA
jgi:hypothetical protein